MSLSRVLLLVGALGACGAPRPQDVSSDQLAADFQADLEALFGLDLRSLPGPSIPPQLLADPKVGAPLWESLRVLAQWRSTSSLELQPLGAHCTAWKEQCDRDPPGVRHCERNSTCGELNLAYSTTFASSASSFEMQWDGLAADGATYVRYVPARVQMATAEGLRVLSSSGDQRPAAPGPWWEAQHAFLGSELGLSSSEWMTTSYLDDPSAGGFRPLQRTVFSTDVGGNTVIQTWRWSPGRKELFLWIVDTVAAGGGCSRLELDEGQVVVEQKGCW